MAPRARAGRVRQAASASADAAPTLERGRDPGVWEYGPRAAARGGQPRRRHAATAAPAATPRRRGHEARRPGPVGPCAGAAAQGPGQRARPRRRVGPVRAPAARGCSTPVARGPGQAGGLGPGGAGGVSPVARRPGCGGCTTPTARAAARAWWPDSAGAAASAQVGPWCGLRPRRDASAPVCAWAPRSRRGRKQPVGGAGSLSMGRDGQPRHTARARVPGPADFHEILRNSRVSSCKHASGQQSLVRLLLPSYGTYSFSAGACKHASGQQITDSLASSCCSPMKKKNRCRRPKAPLLFALWPFRSGWRARV